MSTQRVHFFYATCRSAISWEVPVLNQCNSDKKMLIFGYNSLVSLCLFSVPKIVELRPFLFFLTIMENRHKKTIISNWKWTLLPELKVQTYLVKQADCLRKNSQDWEKQSVLRLFHSRKFLRKQSAFFTIYETYLHLKAVD